MPAVKVEKTRERNPLRARRKQAAEQEPASQSASFRSLIGAARALRGGEWWRIAATVFLAITGVWAYWPVLVELVGAWVSEPDYSHGFLVVPLALYFLWARSSRFPTSSSGGLVLASLLLVLSVVLRYLGSRFFMSFLDAWSILLWIAAVVSVLGGRPLLTWCLPSIGFLWFMVPLPFSLETTMSLPLQRIATKISCWSLQLLGQPAFAEGNVIVVGEHQLEVAQACSGLRLFVGVLALAYVYVVLIRRSWWEKVVVVAAAIPIAIISNASRIVLTGLLFQLSSASGSHQLAHDFAGWAMIPFSAFSFWFLLWYLRKLFPTQEAISMAEMVARAVPRPESF